MDTLRIILIILGLIVIGLIYFWERYKNKTNIANQVVHIPGEDDDPGVIINIRNDNVDDISYDLADLRGFMKETSPLESGVTSDKNRISGAAEELSDHHQAGTEDVEDHFENEIVTLHIIAREDSIITGEALLNSTEALGFTFGDMNIFHFQSQKEFQDTETFFSLVNMYEPGTFVLDSMNEFTTRGVSLFACLDRGEKAIRIFDQMLEVARKMAEQLDAKLCGPDRQAIDNKTINQIRIKLGYDG
jgi:cell division protein ZipA